ncbi:hypothetical protein KY290_024909 [Solanum tuberosum]|uniref:Uncharacterized protein n=1 Tax=Solanum tuberosum TaxID=4113 RepID=A0ABQ7US92_SOLTU|nr:hypothetical protein KY284_023763 [Solanum tuberosum]KAH0754639.1 hypothetical protein KY290_024909 [Solanum tuberosum]
MVIRAQEVSYLIFVRLRGTRPYAPGRVRTQLGGKQEIPQTADMRKFSTNHEKDRISYVEQICKIWKARRVLGEPGTECSKDYKDWLKKSLPETIEHGPNVPHIIADVGAKHQIRLHRL